MSRPLRLRAPADSGAILAVPPLAEAEQLIHDNRKRLDRKDVLVLGRSLPELRRQARDEAVRAASAYLEQAGQPVPCPKPEVLLSAGHQPELFHPGVWLKNFALAGLARRSGAASLNLVVDTDVAGAALLRLPAQQVPDDMGILEGERTLPRLLRLPFDAWGGDVPYEERHVRDEQLFSNLPGRVRAWTGDWGFVPCLPAFWTEVQVQAGRTSLLGERLAGARRTFEQQWGCRNIEVPVSRLCQTEAFAWFACHILVNLAGFQETLNSAIRDYRRRHGIRSRRHPMPELASDDGWLEAPFWAWRSGSGGDGTSRHRARLLVQVTPAAVHLRAGAERWPSLNRGANAAVLVTEWQELERSGYRLRSRALTTTLFARLFLADLFLHGLGGGLYDAVTDEVMRGFYGIEPPRFAILTGTLLLPFANLHSAGSPRRPHEVCRHLESELRDLAFNPQRHLGGDGRSSNLIEEKNAWIGRAVLTRANRRQRFHALRGLNRKLAALLEETIRQRREELGRCRRSARDLHVLGRRDFAFCLYPENDLKSFLSGAL